jgi:asparagine synthase (glutamine-hydrolysing)
MCGICGVLYIDVQRPVDRERLIRMRDIMKYRGPDDEGLFLQANVGLGHRRLSIIDLSGGHQPLSNEDNSVWVVYNGEIYNYSELRNELIARGHIFKTKSDTEVLVHLYEEHGVELLSKLNGMFAFAIWDEKKKNLFLARDRLGIKPLYYYFQAGEFLFASEIKAVLEGGNVRRKINDAALSEFLLFRYVSGAQTLFENIYNVLPGQYLMLEKGGLTTKKYWEIPDSGADGGLDEAGYLHDLHEMVNDAVKIRLISDVPLGTFCSGGVDSSAVSAYVSKIVGAQLNTFSVGFYEQKYDESNYAKQVSKQYDTNHHSIKISNQEFAEVLPQLIWHNDEPLNHPNSVQIYFISKYAKQFVTVVLTGEGADELFGGYPRYFIPQFCYYHHQLNGLCKSLLHSLLRCVKNRKIQLIANVLPYSLQKAGVFNSAWVDEVLVRNILHNGLQDALGYRMDCLGEHDFVSKDDLTRRLLILDIKTYLVSILNRQDKMSMAASIESRVPLLDYRIVEFSQNIPVSLKLKRFDTKYIWKKLALRVLPEEIVNRKKCGFGVPMAQWLKDQTGMGRYLELLRDAKFRNRGYYAASIVNKLIADHLKGLADNSQILWELINFELWAQRFID